jgi:hypothetical protein
MSTFQPNKNIITIPYVALDRVKKKVDKGPDR